MDRIRISNLPSCQSWIKQFSPEDRVTAKKLIDELIYIETSSVIDDLTSEIMKIIDEKKKISIIPIREVLPHEESYYDLINADLNPDMNIPDQPLGSEALISTLINSLSRRCEESIILEYNKITKSNKTPSISCMRKEKVKALVLVDDVIGSGKRSVDFFNFLYKNKTIKSWLSSGVMKIYIICYMATKDGLKFVGDNINKALVDVIHINRCPTFYDSKEYPIFSSLCERYADIQEKNPFGFRQSFVKVIFEHSAPNNIPAILYKKIESYKSYDDNLKNMSNKWEGLFPKRYVRPEFIRDMSISMSGISMKSEIRKLLHMMVGLKQSNLECLVSLTKIEKIKLKYYLKVCHDLGVLDVSGHVVKTTTTSQYELLALNKYKKLIDINKDFYYPIR